MKYSIIIPTYNHCDDLLKPCLESIFKYTDMQQIELIISANGCTDNTQWYLENLRYKFDSLGFGKNLKTIWHDEPLGYARANNVAIAQSTADFIILLNNDVVLLEQPKNQWIEMLAAEFTNNPKCGISCLIKDYSPPANANYAIFFCVMIHRQVFDRIGLLNTQYGKGGMEDVEFSLEAVNAGFEICQVGEKIMEAGDEFWSGPVPLFHAGEGTYHDKTLFPDWDNIFYRSSLMLAKKYNRDWYRLSLCNNFERAVNLKGDIVEAREVTRYNWAAQQITGYSVLEIGCSTGFGVQFLPDNIFYTGIDYSKLIIEVAIDQQWCDTAHFLHADIRTFDLGYYDTIIAFEVIEHLDNGLEILEKLKSHCKTLLITVPYKEPPGFWGEHHRLHGLDESHFPGFALLYINEYGVISQQIDETSRFSLLMGRYDQQ
jgi:glycosyltransferase involved in cell wall biosynthesis